MMPNAALINFFPLLVPFYLKNIYMKVEVMYNLHEGRGHFHEEIGAGTCITHPCHPMQPGFSSLVGTKQERKTSHYGILNKTFQSIITVITLN